MRQSTSRRGAAVMLLVLASLSSCSARAGYGVLLWAPSSSSGDSSPVALPLSPLGPNGTVLPLERKSKIQNVYWLRLAGRRGLVEEPIWRFRAFRTKKEAESFATAYAPLAHVYAYSLRRGLPLREEPGQDARIVYKLDADQVVKVVWRGERPLTAGTYTNYWFRVLTDDGYQGYCFGQYLKLFETRSDPFLEAKALQARDESLTRILSDTWRPEYFREMIDKNRIDLRRFRDDIGLFPDPIGRRITINKATATYQFSYTGIRKLSPSSYQLEGSDLRLELVADNRLVASYRTPERLVSEVYVLIDEDVADVIQKEQKRRQEIYKAFAGSTMHSNAYGTIDFAPDMTFTWTGYQRLVPSVVPAGAGDRGRIDFRYHLDAEAAGRFDGVMTFRFAALPLDSEVSFFYKLEGTAMRLVFASTHGADNLLLRSSAATSWVLFFE